VSDAPAQRWDPELYARNARFVAELGAGVVELLDPRPGERVLDLGCGDGFLSERLAAECAVVGADPSRAQLAAARRRGIAGVACRGERLAFAPVFDAVFSNAALHWMKDAAVVIREVRGVLRPGGRFVGELGGAGCVAAVRAALGHALARRGLDPAAFDPWFFPDDVRYAELLAQGGFEVESIALFPRPTPLPGDVSGWLETFAGSFLAAIAPEARGAAVEEIREELRARLFDPQRGWVVDYVRLRFRARRREPAAGGIP
jgi:SAM-dependent methyltransferase